MIRVENLKKKYDQNLVLDIPELVIEKGESFGLVGNNGAGKTTFFRLILDLIKSTDGKVFSKDSDVHESEHWKSYTGAFLDEGFLIEFLTAEEYFQFINELHGKSKGDLHDFYSKYEEFFDGEILGKKKFIRDLSKGNKQKVGIASAFFAEPEVVILDEPFANIDPSTQFRLKNLINEIKNTSDITLLISSHDLNHITDVCERIAILEKGKVVQDILTSENTLKELESYFAV